MSYNVCYADDLILPIDSGIEDDTRRFGEENIRHFLGSNEWNDPAVKRFLDSSLKKTKRFENIHYSGYTNPSFLIRDIREQTYRPSLIQLDWDLGAGGDAENYIDTLLEITDAKIYILSGNDLIENIEERIKGRRDSHPERGLRVYQKNKDEIEKNAEDNLIEEVVSQYMQLVIEFEFNGETINFSPSIFLPNPNRIWMLESILGQDYMMNFIKENEMVISESKIEKLFEQSGLKFFINTTNTRIYSETGSELHKFYEDKLVEKPLTPIYALKNYDLAILETTMEKGTSKTFVNDER